jgi:hypothetical protein
VTADSTESCTVEDAQGVTTDDREVLGSYKTMTIGDCFLVYQPSGTSDGKDAWRWNVFCNCGFNVVGRTAFLVVLASLKFLFETLEAATGGVWRWLTGRLRLR